MFGPGLSGLFLVSVSFGPGTFNGQDPPLTLTYYFNWNLFRTLVGMIDGYFDGYFTTDMIEAQVDQLVFEDLMRERYPNLVDHFDRMGVEMGWICGPWFLSIFVNMIPWESVLRVWDVILFEGNRAMLLRTALALMELYGTETPFRFIRDDGFDPSTFRWVDWGCV
ncbi:putative Rab-GTPase-TBC domain-containing protein [Helianthus annuus]|nr:putative Rab-GTPase-TBC domain-containing protein [Helianthus annuus]